MTRLLPIPPDGIEPRSGDVCIERVDVGDAGLLRRYCSGAADLSGLLGPGWLTPFDAGLEQDGRSLWVIDRKARVHRVWLTGALDGLRVSPDGPVVHRTRGGIELHYDDGGRDLLAPRGSSARLVHRTGGQDLPCTVVRSASGAIVRVDTPAGALEIARTASDLTAAWVVRRQVTTWRRYRSAAGRLVAVEDERGTADTYELDGSLLVGARHRDEPTQYFEHDGRAPGSRCARTWRDDGSLDHAYTRLGTGRVLVEDTRGQAWQLLWDPTGVSRIDPTGVTTRIAGI